MRAEYYTAASPQRRPYSTGSGAAGPLLLPGLFAAATDIGTRLRGGGALPLIGFVHPHYLMKDSFVDLAVKYIFIELDLSDRLAFYIIDLYLCHYFLASFFPAVSFFDFSFFSWVSNSCGTLALASFLAFFITSRLLVGPGTAPSTTRILFSASIFTTSRFWMVTISPPILPGI